jgi:CRP/FNR family transcriptional regulator, cyclic AMP receptor protein
MVVSYLNPGEFFGEMGLFGEEIRTANLVTRTPCVFANISYDDFHAIRQRYPDALCADLTNWTTTQKYNSEARRPNVY